MYEFHLFAGAGGGILGGMLAGHIPVGAVEIAEYPREVLIQRQIDGCLPLFPVWDDVCTFRADNPECRWFVEYLRGIRDDLQISGGFPCTDISPVGEKAGIDGDESGLWREMARIIREIRPRRVFIENSADLVIRGGVRVLGDLAAMGYDARWGVVGGERMERTRRARTWIVGESYGRGWVSATVYSGVELKSEIRRDTKILPCSGGKGDRRIPVTGIPRMDYGLPCWMERFRAVGMAQIPAVAYLAQSILEN